LKVAFWMIGNKLNKNMIEKLKMTNNIKDKNNAK